MKKEKKKVVIQVVLNGCTNITTKKNDILLIFKGCSRGVKCQLRASTYILLI